ncbi:unnamed protein product [Linum trigynum]|uniref:DUF4218 domain-containing protein n=1 Tax=Linum trigynum TaxID=586398 RepID=A0AAV2E033_9ROSI
MYPMERFLGTLKSFVRNRANPEGSIVERYIAKECSDFCSRYLEGFETRSSRPNRNDDEFEGVESEGFRVFTQQGRTLGATRYDPISVEEFEQIQWYILNNWDEIEDIIK